MRVSTARSWELTGGGLRKVPDTTLQGLLDLYETSGDYTYWHAACINDGWVLQ